MMPAIQRLSASMQRVNRRQQVRQTPALQKRLNLAGNPRRWTPADFWGVKALVALCGGALMFILLIALGQPVYALMAAIAGAMVGFILPELWLNQMIRERQRQVQRALPDAIDLLVICVEAGLGFDGALQRLCSRSDNALTREFDRVLREMQVGRPRREALRDVVARTEVPDLANFIAALVQAEQLGVSVTQVIAVQADQMRTVRRQRAEEMAQQAPIKMLIPMILFIFPALCVVLLGPMWPQVATSGLGQVVG
jgi:tight adherence protein C